MKRGKTKLADIIQNYVKFRRGTPDAFAALAVKDSDTLYFIYEEDELTGELYLGSKLIAGAGDVQGVTALRALTDVLLSENLNADDCLIYDITQSKWVNKPIMSVIDNFVGANNSSVGVPGLVPAAPAAGETGLFLRSDGQWAEVVTASSAQIFQTIVATGETHSDAIARIIGNADIQVGDILVLQELIYEPDNYQHISYVYDGNNWVAMDGNYSAETIYLTNDLTITADIGVQKLEGKGSKVLDTAGKNLKQVLEMLLTERKLPTKVNPSVSVSCNEAKSYEVGTSVSPSYSAVLYPGSYSFGPETEVKANSWSAIFNGVTLTTASGTFNPIVITDGFNQKISVIAQHNAGAIPNDNLGNAITDSVELISTQIMAGEKTGYSEYISGYRNSFFGSYIEPVSLNSDNIRALDTIKRSDTSSIVSFDIVENATQVIIAVPSEYVVTSVCDNKAFEVDIFNSFVKTIVSVEGANSNYDKDYNVYVYNPKVALGANTYTVSIKNE